MFSGGPDVAGRCIHDDNAAFRCLIDIDVVHPDSGPADQRQVLGPVK